MNEQAADCMAPDPVADEQRVLRRHRARHTKSRNGCYNCKSRRIKCDELQPACGTCASRGEPCSYPRPRSPSKKLPRSRQKQDDGGSQILDKVAPSDGCPPPDRAELSQANTQLPAIFLGHPHSGPDNLVMDDLRLLQFFNSHTASQMARNPRRVMVWQRVIPEFASRNRYLMHLLLALGGLHMVTRRAESNIHREIESSEVVDLTIIEEHHQRGLEGFREEVSRISTSNADHVLAGSMLLVAFAFASLKVEKLNPSTEGPEQIASGSFSKTEILRLNWLYLNRGVSSVIGDQWNVLKASRLRQMVVLPNSEQLWNDLVFDAMSSRLSRCSPRLMKFAEGADQAVANINASLSSFEPHKDDFSNCSGTPTSQYSPSITSDSILDAHYEALGILDKSYSRILAVLRCAATEYPVDAEIQMDLEEAAILSWPVILPTQFLSSAQESEQNFLYGHSLVLLAHFYLINTLVDFWFLRNSFEREIVKINALISALNDPLLSTLMRWPNEVLAVSPNYTP